MAKRGRVFCYVLFFLVVLPFALAGPTYGSGVYGDGPYSGEEETVGAAAPSGGGGGGRAAAISRGVQFDIKILDFDSPLPLGKSFDFTYFVKGVGEVNNDVIVEFWIEREGEVVTSGSDVIFMGVDEERTDAASLFLPTNLESGIYQFNIKVNLGETSAESHRTVELFVEKKFARVAELFDIRFFLEEVSLEVSEDVSIVAIFENLGAEPALVNLTFIILDSNGTIIYEERESVLVEIEEVMRKSFERLTLDGGKYTFVLETLYNGNISSEFRQDFEVRKPAFVLKEELIYAFIGVGIGGVITTVLIIIFSRLERKRKKKKRSRGSSLYSFKGKL